MYKIIISYIFLISLNNFIHESIAVTNLCKDISSKSMDLQLKTYLFCDYDSDIRPINNKKNTTNINITIMPKMIEFVSMNTFIMRRIFLRISFIYSIIFMKSEKIVIMNIVMNLLVLINYY
jgi:hypothetical protein